MRFVGALILAMALLAWQPSPGWSQISVPGPGVPLLMPGGVPGSQKPRPLGDVAVRPAAASLAAPSVEGSWVSDAGADQTPAPTRPRSNAPLPYAAYNAPVANIYGDPSLGPPSFPGMQVGYNPGMPQGMPPGMAPGMGPGMPPGMAPPGCGDGLQDPSGPPGGPMPPGMPGGPGDACGMPLDDSLESRFLRGCLAPLDTDLWNDVRCHHRFYGSLDVLAWWTRGNPVPALVTTSPVGTPQTVAGVLGQPTTTTIFGDGQVDTLVRSGARVNLGYWLVDGEFWGVEGHYLALASSGTDWSRYDNFSTGVGNAILARPFFNTQTAAQDAALVAFPNYNLNGTLVNLNGSIDVRTTTNLQSAGALLRHLLWVDFTSQYRIDLVGGYRFFRADDSVMINDAFTTQGGLLAPTTFTSSDLFGAYNIFNGGELGVAGQFRLAPRLSLSTMTKIALGNVSEKVTISGVNSITTLGTTVTTPGGLLTQPTNIGTYHRNQFGILPEVQFNLRYDVTRNWRLLFGYTCIWLNRVQRSGTAIDTTLNPTQINGGTLVGEARPAFSFASSTFWAQGFNVGLEYRW